MARYNNCVDGDAVDWARHAGEMLCVIRAESRSEHRPS